MALALTQPLQEMSRGKAVSLQAWSGPQGSRKLRFPDFMTTAQDGGKVVSLTHRPAFTSMKCPWYSFPLEAELTLSSLRSILILSFHLWISLTSGLFRSGLPTKTVQVQSNPVIASRKGLHILFHYIRGLLEKYPTVFFYANTWWIII